MASAMYNEFKKKIGTVDWGNASVDIRVMLVTSSYTVDIDTHLNLDDINGLSVEVANGNGYTTGGKLTTGRAVTVDLANDWSKFDADDTVWATSTITARGAIVYLDTGVASTSTLISFVDFVTDKSSSAGDFIVQWHADGVYRIA